MKLNYEKDMMIDETALDVEWLTQPALMMKYVRHAAETRSMMDNAKEVLELKKAELDAAIRAKPEKFGIEKITEAVIQSKILVQDIFMTYNNEYLESKFEYDVAVGAVRACEQRKEALENLVRLHGQQYFAGPKVPRDLTEERKQKEVDAGVARKLKRQRTK